MASDSPCQANKIRMRADAEDGYCNDFQVYTRKEAGRIEQGLGGPVITDLTRAIQGHFHTVNCDNYSTAFSPVTFMHVELYGLIDNFPSSQDLWQQGDMVPRNGHFLAVKWRDRRIDRRNHKAL